MDITIVSGNFTFNSFYINVRKECPIWLFSCFYSMKTKTTDSKLLSDLSKIYIQITFCARNKLYGCWLHLHILYYRIHDCFVWIEIIRFSTRRIRWTIRNFFVQSILINNFNHSEYFMLPKWNRWWNLLEIEPRWFSTRTVPSIIIKLQILSVDK